MDILTTAALLLIGFLLTRLLQQAGWWRKSQNLPPGPKGLPFIGNLFQLPKENEWVAFRDMGKVYGADTLSCLHTDSELNSSTILYRRCCDTKSSWCNHYSTQFSPGYCRPTRSTFGELLGQTAECHVQRAVRVAYHDITRIQRLNPLPCTASASRML